MKGLVGSFLWHRLAPFVLALFLAGCELLELSDYGDGLDIVPARARIRPGVEIGLAVKSELAVGRRDYRGEPIEWRTETPTVAVVIDEAGTILGLAPGDARISAQVGSTRVHALVQVRQRRLVRILLVPTRLRLEEGRSRRLELQLGYSDGSAETITRAEDAWSQTSTVAVLGPGLMLEALAPGDAILHARLAPGADTSTVCFVEPEPCSATSSVTVVPSAP